MSEHPEFDSIIAQMRSLESLFLHEADKPVTAKDLLPLCEAIRRLAAKLALIDDPLVASSDFAQESHRIAVE